MVNIQSTLQSTFISAIVEQFFEQQKEDARKWLRSEMDSLVENLFTQLKVKFNCLMIGDSSSTMPQQQQMNSFQQQNHLQNAQPIQQQNSQQIRQQIQQQNSVHPIVKEEILDDEQQLDVRIQEPSSSSSSSLLIQPLTNPIPNSIPNPIPDPNPNSQPQPQHELDSDGECDCTDCLTIEFKEEDTDDDSQDSIRLIDDLGITPRPIKRIKTEDGEGDSSSLLLPQEAQIHETFYDIGEDEEHAYEEQGGGIVETQSLNCLIDSCVSVFGTRGEMEQHLYLEHGIWPMRCLQRGCTSSFANPYQLKHHLRLDHSDLIQWQCPLCPHKQYRQYKLLTFHYRNTHYRGRFKCTFPDCYYTSEYRSVVFSHYNDQHHPQSFACPFPGCNRAYTLKGNLKRHQRTHLGIKPYLCRWPGCGYASERSCATIQHIRVKHFKLPMALKKQAELNIDDDRDPRVYLEVQKQLLYRPNL